MMDINLLNEKLNVKTEELGSNLFSILKQLVSASFYGKAHLSIQAIEEENLNYKIGFSLTCGKIHVGYTFDDQLFSIDEIPSDEYLRKSIGHLFKKCTEAMIEEMKFKLIEFAIEKMEEGE